MRNRIAFVILICGVFCLASRVKAQQIVQTLRQTSLGNDIFLLQGTVSVGTESFAFTAIKFPVKGHRLRIVDTTQIQGNNSLLGIMNETKAKAVLSGGFVSAYNPPIPTGLVQHDGVLLNRLAKDELLNGVVTAGQGRIEIHRVINVSKCLSDCLQAGPLLVEDSKVYEPDVYSKSEIEGRRRRAFVATLPRDYVFVGIAENVSLASLAAFLSAPPDRHGLGCKKALNLSGSTSAGLVWDGGSEGNALFPIANALVIQ